MQVSEDRKVHVSEDLEVYFTKPSHGIIRSIPLKSSDVGNVSVNAPFELSYSGGNMEVKIGSADRLVAGEVNYHIEYNLQMYSSKPEFYYNLVGMDWDVPINNASFAVRMPKSIDPDRVGLSIGSYGTRGFDGDARFVVRNMDIVGVTQRRLDAHEGITLRVEVPDDYFQNVQNKWGQKVWNLMFLFTFLSFMVWYLYGKDEHVTPVVTFNAPQDITPADAELIMTEKISEKGLIALLVKLANDGYFKIDAKGKNFKLFDFKPYRGNNVLERKLLLSLSSETDKSGTVTDKMLKSSRDFYGDWMRLSSVANAKKNKKLFYEANSVGGILPFIVLLCVIGNILLTVFSLLGYRIYADNLALISGFMFVLIIFVTTIVSNQNNWAAKLYAFFMTLSLFLSFLIPMYGELMNYIAENNISQIVGGLLCVLISAVCYVQMMKPNNKGRMLKGKFLGMKKFIEVAEKERLEKMVEENPSYFYKVLPYAYVLGVSKAWIKRFEGMAVPPPEWAAGTVYNINSFDGFTSGFHSAVMPSYENGGISRSSSSGGGGFSGGGFGGGGGRSW